MIRKASKICVIGIIFLVPSLNAQTWGIAKRLTWNSGESSYPKIAVSSSNAIHVIWQDYSPGNSEIYHKKSTDGGVTWANKRLSWNSEDSVSPAIAVDSSSTIHVAWQDFSPGYFEIYYKRSTNDGATWGAAKRLTWTSASSLPEIAAGPGNNVHLFWSCGNPGNREIYYKKSIDGGSVWTTKRLTWNSGDSRSPSITFDSNGHIHLAWYDDTPGNTEIYYSNSNDGGTSWTTKRLTWTAGQSFGPHIVADSNNHIHMVWVEWSSGWPEIYYKRSTNGGNDWSTKRLTWTFGASYSPVIAVDANDHIHVGWSDKTPGNFDIYFKKSTNGGMNWDGATRLTWNNGDSKGPKLAIDKTNNIHLLWYDYSPGMSEIYHRKGKQ